MYQHGDNSYLARPKIMSRAVFDNLLRRMRDYCDRRPSHRMQITLHGGEPTLIGIAELEALATAAREQLGHRLSRIVMQTNGTLIDEAWAGMLKKCQIETAVSIDGPADIHDSMRVDHFGRGSHAAALRGLKLLQSAGIFGGVICVINPAQSGIDCYRFLRSEGIDNMNFLTPDATHDTKASLYGAFGETPVADYLIPIFDAWYDEDNPQVKVRLFLAILTMLLGGAPIVDSLGNPLMSYLIIESDGSIQALDTLRICQEGLPDTGLNVATHGFDDLEKGFPLAHRLVHEGIPSCSTCHPCSEHAICGGGYLPHRYARRNGFDNPSAWCADIIKLVRHIRRRAGIGNVTLN
jgi:uncharacterized protein